MMKSMEVDTVVDMMGDMVKKFYFIYYTWLVALPVETFFLKRI